MGIVIPVIKETKPGMTIAHDPVPGDCECAILANFRRGDANADGKENLTEAVFVLGHLFGGGEVPTGAKSADANDSGSIDITDAIYLFWNLFLGGPAPPAPFPSCGPDLTAESLDCAEPPHCAPFNGVTFEVNR